MAGIVDGTELLLDIVACPVSFGFNHPIAPSPPVELDGKLYSVESRSFAALQGVWVTDGTPQGTVLFKDNLDRSELYVFGCALYMMGFMKTGHSGFLALFERHYWKSDGTSVEGMTKIGFVGDDITFFPSFEFDERLVFTGQNS